MASSMIVPQHEIDLIVNPRLRRRQMRLPASNSPKAKCSLRLGGVYKCQPRPFAPAQATVTVVKVSRESLEELSLAAAKREGYAGVQGALAAWTRSNGPPKDGQLVWVVEFVKGDEAEMMSQDAPLYLSKVGDYTTIAGKQAVRGDPELCLPLPGAAESARVIAIAQRQGPALGAINKATREVETLREAMTSMRSRNRARLIERELGKLRSELPVTEIARSA